MDSNLIPEQKVGSKLDLSSEKKFATYIEAQEFFKVAKQRLMSVNQWDEICKAPSSVFKLMNDKCQQVVGLVKEGDFISSLFCFNSTFDFSFSITHELTQHYFDCCLWLFWLF